MSLVCAFQPIMTLYALTDMGDAGKLGMGDPDVMRGVVDMGNAAE